MSENQIEILKDDENHYRWKVVVGGQTEQHSAPLNFPTEEEAYAAALKYTKQNWPGIKFLPVPLAVVAK